MSEDAPDWGGKILRVKIGDREVDAAPLKALLGPRMVPASSWTRRLEDVLAALGLPKPEYIREK